VPTWPTPTPSQDSCARRSPVPFPDPSLHTTHRPAG